MSLTKQQITESLTQLHEWFAANSSSDPKSTVRNSIAIAQRVLISNDINVQDRKELTSIVIDELFPSDAAMESLVREVAIQLWRLPR